MKLKEENGLNDSNMMSAGDMVNLICKNLDPSTVRNAGKIINLWKEIVESIKSTSINGENIGRNMSSHSRVIDLQNGVLLVEADHPGWIQMIGNYKKYILKGFKLKAPELDVNTIAFRLTGSNVELAKVSSEVYASRERKNLEEKFEREQKQLEEQGFTSKKEEGESKKLPPELEKIFQDLKNDMLTNDK